MAYGCDATIRDINRERPERKEPSLRIPERLKHLADLEDPLIHDASLILQRAVQSNSPLLRIQEPRLTGRIREQDQEHDAPRRRDGPQDDKEQAPGSKARVDLPDAVREQAGDGVGDAVADEPEGHARGLLAALVEHAGEEGEARGDGGLGGAEEKAGNHQPGVAVRGAVGHEDDAPDRHRRCEVLAQGEADGEVGGGPGPEEVAEVED